MLKIFYLLIIFYIITGIYFYYKKYKQAKKDFEETFISKKYNANEFKKRIEISVTYEHKKDNKKLFRMGISIEEILYRIFYWPFI